MRRKFHRRKYRPNCNLILLVFILFLFFLILIQRIQIENLCDDEDDDECLVPISTQVAPVMLPDSADKSDAPDTERKENQLDLPKDTAESDNGNETAGPWSGEEEEPLSDLERQVAMTAAKQIRISAQKETIKAQCILARTSILDAQKNGTSVPASFTESDLQQLWGDDWEKNLSLFEECAKETEGEALTYHGNYIYAAYHAVSAGTTRSMTELYQDTDMPYLANVTCPKDASADNYLAVLYWEKDEFLKKCGELTQNAQIGGMAEVQITGRDSADYVLTVQIGNASCSGEEFRSAFSLNSACFTIADLDQKVRIVTKGIGHGFGMSQAAANEMAAGGASCQELLSAFFPNAVLEQSQNL